MGSSRDAERRQDDRLSTLIATVRETVLHSQDSARKVDGSPEFFEPALAALAELERVKAELPEDLLHLLREVDRRGGLRHANLTLNRRMGGGWSARWGNTMLLSPDTYGPERERRTDWLLIEYPPPLKPISERVVTEEVGP